MKDDADTTCIDERDRRHHRRENLTWAFLLDSLGGAAIIIYSLKKRNRKYKIVLHGNMTSASTQKRLVKGFVTYMGYFGAKYVGNDIQVLCGNILDHAWVKTFTLFCIMYQATDDFKLGIFLTVFFMIAQFIVSLSPNCNSYVDKTVAKRIHRRANIWPQNPDVDSLGVPHNNYRRGNESNYLMR